MPRLTIKEIAEMAKVSPTAVSFVINNRKGVSAATRQKVIKIINSTKFIPNKSSQRLSLKKSFNICLVMNPKSSPFSDLFYYDITRGIVEESSRCGYSLLLSQIDCSDRDPLPNSVRNHDADGLILLQDTPERILRKIKALKLPFVLVDAQVNISNKYTTINPDSECSAYVATEYLIKKGHRDIAFIGSSYLPRYYQQTSNGFERAMNDNKLPIKPSWVFSDAQDEKTAYMGMKKILKNRKIPSAVFCAGDIFAIGAVKCAQDEGYSVPGDISFIGMDDIILSNHITPPLTTIGFDTFEMGKMAVNLLVKKINNETADSYTVPSENIIERDSVRSR
jgi:DNA-binding LacI/PurR family transcriptional regulator